MRLIHFEATRSVFVWLFLFAGVFILIAVTPRKDISYVEGQEENVTHVPNAPLSPRDIEAQIRQVRLELESLKKKRESFADELRIIDLEIQKTEFELDGLTYLSDALDREIANEKDTLEKIAFQKEAKRAVLARSLRGLAEYDADAIEVLLRVNQFSDFFDVFTQFSQFIETLRSNLQEIIALEAHQKEAEGSLERKKNVLSEGRGALLLGKLFLEREHAFRTEFLKKSKNQSTDLERILAELRREFYLRKEIAYATRTEGRVGIPLEEAVTLAEQVSERVGIRPALLLAVLSVESDLGEHLGVGHWELDMHPSQWQAFLVITSKLGLDPDDTPVSAKPGYGWGGAMGAAQFLPQTWLGYEDEVRAFTGHETPSPWNFEDAFSAAAIKLAKDGAISQYSADEWRAAMIYFAGENWDNPALSFYGDRVLAMAEIFRDF